MLYTSISRATKWEYVGFNLPTKITGFGCATEHKKEIRDLGKRITNFIYHIIDQKDNRVVYVGLSIDPKRRFVEHKQGQFKDKDVSCKIVHKLSMFEDVNKIEREEIAKFTNLLNIQHNKRLQPSVIKQSTITFEREAKDTIYTNEKREMVVFIWFENNKRGEKSFKYGKKRTREQALEAANKFQREMYL